MSTNSEGAATSAAGKQHARHVSPEDRDLPSSVLAAMSGPGGWSGPVPPPELFAAYSKISPDMPERIMRMIEAENKYQQEQSRRIERSARVSAIAQMTLVLLGAIVTILAAFALRAQQQDILAILIAVIPFVATAAALGMNIRTMRRRNGEEE